MYIFQVCDSLLTGVATSKSNLRIVLEKIPYSVLNQT